MAPTLTALTRSEGGPLVLGEELGRGGEGSVHALLSHGLSSLPPASTLVVKLYHAPTEDRRGEKVKAMLLAPPSSPALAWPLAMVVEEGRFRGFLMARLASDAHRTWAELAHARTRRSVAPAFDVRYALTAVQNLAVALQALHGAGHRQGDVNESNIFVASDARVFLVDLDSAQVRGAGGEVFPCPVGKPEFTAPELTHGALREQERTPASDTYGMAVAAYQMLTGGAHPTDLVWTGAEDPPSVVERIRSGLYPALAPSSSATAPPRVAVAGIPSALRALLLSCLSPSPASRPNLTEVMARLQEVRGRLQQCGRVSHHWFDPQDGACGWCAHQALGQPDPWAPEAASQQLAQEALPPLSFQEEQELQIRRASPTSPAPPSAPPRPGPVGQSSPWSSTPAPPAASPQQNPTPPPQQKGAGRRTILTYADGSSGPRPPLMVLFRVNPRLALSCLRSELPDYARFWWPPSRNVAQPLGLAVGELLGAALACLWFFLLPLLLTPLAGDWGRPLWVLAGYTATATAFIAVTSLTLSGLWDRRRTAKAPGGLSRYRSEAPPRTWLRHLTLACIYGPMLLLLALGALLLLLVEGLLGQLQSTSRGRW